MKRIGFLVLLTTVLLAVPAPASAQQAVEVEALIGLQGYVAPYRPTTLTARVTANVLFVGELRVSFGNVNLATAIEVPAGSSKEYALAVPAASNNGRAVLQLFAEGAEDELVREVVSVLNPSNKVLVGVVGAPTVVPSLAAAATVPFERDLTVLELGHLDLAGDLAPLSYLVAGKGAFAALDPAVLAAIGSWVNDGGRLVGSSDELERIEGEVGRTAALHADATVSSLGRGELVVVEDPAGITDWGTVIRDVPPLSLSTNQFVEEFGFQMVEAAGAGGQSTTPGIPWLLAALAFYVLLVGPINFLILRRMDRRELAWVTIPVMSAVMLAGLWIAGRSQLDDRIVTHASIVVQEDAGSRAHSTMIIVAGGEGEHTLDTPAGWSVAPLDVSMMFGQGNRIEARVGASPEGGTRLGFELPNLGAVTATARWNPDPIPIRVDVATDGASLTATLHNDSNLSFWAWGIGEGSTVRAGSGSLEPGQSGSATLRPGVGFFEGGSPMADAILSQGNFDFSGRGPDPWMRVYPLSETLYRQEARVLQEGSFFFGFTDDLTALVAVDGSPEVARGPSLIVVPFDAPGLVGPSQDSGDIVRIVGAGFVDAYPGWLYASGADAVEVRFRVPTGLAGDATISNRGGNVPAVESLEVYNWTTGTFDTYEWRESFAVGGHVSPTNELMARIVLADGQFNDLDLPTGSLILAAGSS